MYSLVIGSISVTFTDGFHDRSEGVISILVLGSLEEPNIFIRNCMVSTAIELLVIEDQGTDSRIVLEAQSIFRVTIS